MTLKKFYNYKIFEPYQFGNAVNFENPKYASSIKNSNFFLAAERILPFFLSIMVPVGEFGFGNYY